MYFERRQLIQSLDLACYVLMVYIWLLDGRTVWLGLKALSQVQFCNPVLMQPDWDLAFFLAFSLVWNAIVMVFTHLLGPSRVVAGKERSLMLDFVGQQYSPSRIHMMALDVVACALQLALIVIAFEVGKDEAKAEHESSVLDVTPLDLGEQQGQGWDTRDEEAAHFTPQHTSLDQPIAIIRVKQLCKQLYHLQLPTIRHQPASDEPIFTNVQPQTRPDTSRLRRFSRPQAAHTPPPIQPVTTAADDDSWPPMWLILARNMVGTDSSSLAPLRRSRQALTSFAAQLAPRRQQQQTPETPTTEM